MSPGGDNLSLLVLFSRHGKGTLAWLCPWLLPQQPRPCGHQQTPTSLTRVAAPTAQELHSCPVQDPEALMRLCCKLCPCPCLHPGSWMGAGGQPPGPAPDRAPHADPGILTHVLLALGRGPSPPPTSARTFGTAGQALPGLGPPGSAQCPQQPAPDAVGVWGAMWGRAKPTGTGGLTRAGSPASLPGDSAGCGETLRRGC